MKLIASLSAIALLLAAGSPLLAQESAPADTTAADAAQTEAPPVNVPALRQQANAAYGAQDYAALLSAAEQLHELRPWNADYMALLVVAYALNNDRARAYEMMLEMQRQGLSHDFSTTDDTASLRGTEAFDYINDLMVRAGEPAGEATVEFQLPGNVLLPTAIDWDPTRDAYLVTNARDGAVFRVAADGTTQTILQANDSNGLWGIYGLLVDAENDRLWLTSSAGPNFSGFREEDKGRSALFEFELGSLELVRKYPVPADARPHRLGDLVMANGGDIYTVDTVLPIIYRLERGQDRLRPFVASGDNVSFRSITASDQGRLLYVADYEMGITVLDLVSKRAARMTGPETLNFGGIEGLEYWQGYLVMIQNGNEPQRIMRLKLDPTGTVVETVAPLAIAQPFFNYPNYGTVHDGKLVFFANSHWIRDLAVPEPIRVASTGLAEAPDLMSPDLDKFWDDYYEKTGTERPAEREDGP